MKRITLAAIAVAILAIPAAQAQPRHHDGRGHPGVHRPAAPHKATRPVVRPPHAHAKRWTRGHRYSNWRQHGHVRDYHRYGLRRPGPGQQWIKVNNDYLLVATATGIIASIIAGR